MLHYNKILAKHVRDIGVRLFEYNNYRRRVFDYVMARSGVSSSRVCGICDSIR